MIKIIYPYYKIPPDADTFKPSVSGEDARLTRKRKMHDTSMNYRLLINKSLISTEHIISNIAKLNKH